MLTPTVDKKIAAHIRAYPTLFGCRTKVLEQWFCVIGNGTEWVDGELQAEPLCERTLEENISFATQWIQERLDDPYTKNNPELQARYRIMHLYVRNKFRFRV